MNSAPEIASHSGRNTSLEALRGFVTFLVVVYHSVLAYMAILPPTPPLSAGLWRVFPIIDAARWPGFDLFFVFNNIYFMSLMFFLSGLFVWQSLKRKGAARFLRDRLKRLGLPFLFTLLALAPLAYYPALLAGGAQEGPGTFWLHYLPMGLRGLMGPAWFLWMLLAFDGVAATVFSFAARIERALIGIAGLGERPILLFFGLCALSAAAYLPAATLFGPDGWTSVGPFSFQLSRPLHYFVYFAAGTALGAAGAERGFLAADGGLARRWPLWTLLAVAVFAYFLGLSIKREMLTGEAQHRLEMVTNLVWVFSCAASCFALLAIFVRFVRRQSPIWSSFCANAYAIYLVHYAVVVWAQFALTQADWSGLAKGLAAAALAVVVSWTIAAAARRVPLVAQTI